jgi:hypothetical protein
MANSKNNTAKTSKTNHVSSIRFNILTDFVGPDVRSDLLTRSQRFLLADLERKTGRPVKSFVQEAVGNWLFDVVGIQTGQIGR